MKLAIITGGSKGLGRSLVKTYCDNGCQTISIARTRSSFKHNNLITQIEFDLSNVNFFELFEKKLAALLEDKKPKSVVLINNAGMLGEIKRLENRSYADIIQTNQINLTVPLLFSSMIIRKFKDIKTTIINISSGAAHNPYFGWVGYCTSKAGIEMMTQNIALEQYERRDFKILSIKPGVVDTAMQKQIRKVDENEFPDKQKFIDLHKNQLLLKPDEVSEMIYSISIKNKFKSGSSVDVRDL